MQTKTLKQKEKIILYFKNKQKTSYFLNCYQLDFSSKIVILVWNVSENPFNSNLLPNLWFLWPKHVLWRYSKACENCRDRIFFWSEYEVLKDSRKQVSLKAGYQFGEWQLGKVPIRGSASWGNYQFGDVPVERT